MYYNGAYLQDFSGDDRMEYRMPANLFTKLKSTFDKAKESKKRKKTANELPVLAGKRSFMTSSRLYFDTFSL